VSQYTKYLRINWAASEYSLMMMMMMMMMCIGYS